jgi:hypothetical protein
MVTIEVGNEMLTNQRRGTPTVKPFRYYLFCYRVRTFKAAATRRHWFLEIIEAPTQKGADSKLAKFIARKDVVLLSRNGRRLRKP